MPPGERSEGEGRNLHDHACHKISQFSISELRARGMVGQPHRPGLANDHNMSATEAIWARDVLLKDSAGSAGGDTISAEN